MCVHLVERDYDGNHQHLYFIVQYGDVLGANIKGQKEVLWGCPGERRNGGEVGMSGNKTEMKIYKRLIKPMMLVPTSSNDYSPKQVQIEPEEKWYPEENRETLVQKYKYLETAFETLVFEDKYEEIKIPEIVRCKDCKYRDPEDMKCDCGHDIRWQMPRPDDWFCADGGRR